MKLNCELIAKVLENFIRDELSKAGFSRVVVGLSGGIDSAVACLLATRALGAENVRAVLMPYRASSKESLIDASSVVNQLRIKSETIEITSIVDGYFSTQPEANSLRRGNAMARARMIVLFDKSMEYRALVLGTSNKTELLLGYGTLHGDMASAVNPIGDLYKTQVWALAQAVGVSDSVVRKQPSADLFQGQTDEDDLGFRYRQVDELLYLMVDERYSTEELEAAGFEPAFIRRVSDMVRNSQFKRRLPVIAKVSQRTIDRDFRYARDWGR